MFDQVLAQRKPIPRWVAPTLAFAILFHACALSGAIVHGYWDVDRLPVPKGRVDLVVPAPSPPPPAGGASSAPPKPQVEGHQLRRVNERTQVIKLMDQKPAPATGGEATQGTGNGLGIGNGIGDGKGECVGITCGEETSDPPDDTKVHVETPKIRDQPLTEVDKHFLSGVREIHPDDGTRTKMGRDGITRTRVTVKMCLSAGGRVSSLDLLESSGYPEYDAKIRSTMRSWRYSPFGGDTTVCTPVTFIYNIR